MPAFDARRPPEKSLMDACVHCGFCLPACPTYALWGEEMDSPRGRIVLMADGLTDGSTMTADAAEHFDRCLGCMACVTACPSGVRYDLLIEAVRPQIVRNAPRSRRDRIVAWLVTELFTHPDRLRALRPILSLAELTGLARAARSAFVARRLPSLAALARLAPRGRVRSQVRGRSNALAAERRGKVALLQGCVQRALFAHVNAATVAVLTAEGFEVAAPTRPRCCGALLLHTGYEEHAAGLARETIAALENYESVIVNAAGCGSAMKGYGHLLGDDIEWRGRAEAFSDKVKDVSEFLAGVEATAPRRPVPLKVAYHDACHLAHAQGVRAQPRTLLGEIPGLELLEPEDAEMCCGSAGVYNLLQPRAADELGARKARALLATGAQAIVSGNPGCTLQISAHLAESGNPLPVYHLMELLAMSIGP